MSSTAEEASRYWREETLRDGTTIVIRAIRPDDRERLLRHFNSMSEEARYFRFFGLKRALTDTDLDHFTRLDFVNHVGLVAVTSEDGQERFIGVGRYIVHEGSSNRAEVAFAVLDDYQGRGIGTLLLEHLAVMARRQGILEFTAEVMGANAKMLEVFENSGFAVRESREPGAVHVAFPIEAASAFLAAHAHRESDGRSPFRSGPSDI
ncbi:MAG: GNAT family N-acetyltransferase [Deltaproteobacteria bacterium]|nr:GNAT family N-acetyltransferase [Deltaproteobacteria bacterium]